MTYYLKGDMGEVEMIKSNIRQMQSRIQIREVTNWKHVVDKFKNANVVFSAIDIVDIYECENINASDFPLVKFKLTFHKCKNITDFGSWKGKYVYFEECTISEFRSGELEFESTSFQHCTFKCELECAFIKKQLCLQYCEFLDPRHVYVSCEKVDALVVENCKMKSLKAPSGVKKLQIRDCRELQKVENEEFPSTLEHLEIKGCRDLKTVPKFSSVGKNVTISLVENLNLLALDVNKASVISFELERCPRLALVGYVSVQKDCTKFDIRDCWSLSFRDAVRFTLGVSDIEEMYIWIGRSRMSIRDAILYVSVVLIALNAKDRPALPNELQVEVLKMLRVAFNGEVKTEQMLVGLQMAATRRRDEISDMYKYLLSETAQWERELDDIERRVYAVRGIKL